MAPQHKAFLSALKDNIIRYENGSKIVSPEQDGLEYPMNPPEDKLPN